MDFKRDENDVPTLTLRADDPAAEAVAAAIGTHLTHHKGAVSLGHVEAARQYKFATEAWLAAKAEHPRLPE